MKQDWTRREDVEPDRFHYPIFVYYGLAVESCQGPELLRHVEHDHNHTWTHWQVVDLSRTPIPRPPPTTAAPDRSQHDND